MKKIYAFLTSIPFMAFLFLVLAFAMALATFIESSHGTTAARSMVYNAFWFELLWGLFALNLLNNFVKYKLYRLRKLTIGLFHISFLIMILGAAVTRWFSFEGTMHIRENERSGSILSSENYFYASVHGEAIEKEVRFSERTPRQFSAKFDVDGKEIRVKTVAFIPHAERQPVASAAGEAVIDLVFSAPDRQGMQSHILRPGDKLEYPGLITGFESGEETPLLFFLQNEKLFLVSHDPVEESTMANATSVRFAPGDTIPIKKMFLYQVNDFRILVREYFNNATFTAVKSSHETGEQAVLVEVTEGTQKQLVSLFGHAGQEADTLEVRVAGHPMKLAYGAQPIPLSFSLFLKDFQLERYPGSDSPSSYASEVVLTDETEGINRDVRIYMNNTLTHKGFKFFQSSYDRDEQGTILSVNYDFWGTWISYLSYALMTLGFALSLINKNAHFRQLINRLKNSSAKYAVLMLLPMLFNQTTMAQMTGSKTIPPIDPQVVKSFGELWVQGVDGRIEPMNTINSEIVRKVAKKSTLFGKNSDEVILSMMTWPEIWQTLPFIRVANKTVAGQLGISGNTVSLHQLFDQEGRYLITEPVRAAFSKPPAQRNRVEKEYIYLDERVSICFMVFRGSLFHLFPAKNSEDKWYAPGEEAPDFSDQDSVIIKNGFQDLIHATGSNNSHAAIQTINQINSFQQQYGAGLLPAQSKKIAEILYNKVNPFKRIFPFYLTFGFLLLFVLFVNIFRLKPLPSSLKNAFFIAILLLFVIHTAGIIFRWYIAGRAPWSNGYESIVYVAWSAMLAGFIFGRKYAMVIGTAAFLAGISLFVAHLSWMNPEITPLVPVLKSYWLTIHVSVITASYGFIGLSAFLGMLVMILMVIRKKQNENKVNHFIHQLTTINEMSATIGLYFLTIGTFLGGIWANESWGRYWGWDPKETWSLITIVVYSFIVHMRLIPSMKGVYNYNLASVLGLGSVIMTYFGVNYYLSGLHSYGQGVAGNLHPAVPVALAALAGLMLWAYLKDTRYASSRAENKKRP